MTRTCATCRHWGSEKERTWDAVAAEMQICGAITPGWRTADDASRDVESDPNLPGSWDAEKPDPADAYMNARSAALRKAKAAVWDGSEYWAELCTTAEFGCLLHEERRD